MTEMTNEAKRELANLVEDWGMIGVLRALAGFCGHWSRHYDPSPATAMYGCAEGDINAIVDRLESKTNVS